ncbi:Uncharacterised protein [Bordetella pertussis]|nr:Uncharacterised protein [Bordetella pertussis]
MRAIHRLLVANSATWPAPSSMMALSKPLRLASRMARWPLGYRHDALASVGAMLGQERAKLEKQAEKPCSPGRGTLNTCSTNCVCSASGSRKPSAQKNIGLM